jgi:hypothetical protein
VKLRRVQYDIKSEMAKELNWKTLDIFGYDPEGLGHEGRLATLKELVEEGAPLFSDYKVSITGLLVS